MAQFVSYFTGPQRGATAGIVICKIEQFGEFSKTDCFNLRLYLFDPHENHTLTMFFSITKPKTILRGSCCQAMEYGSATSEVRAAGFEKSQQSHWKLARHDLNVKS